MDRKKDEKNSELLKYISYGLGLGTLLGVSFAVITSSNISICCSLGMCMGVLIGCIVSMFKK